MECSEFMKVLCEENGGKDEKTKAAFAEHRRSCSECDEFAAAYQSPDDEADAEPADLREKIMAKARAEAASERLLETLFPPRRRVWPAVLVAALVLVFATVTFGLGRHPSETPTVLDSHMASARVLLGHALTEAEAALSSGTETEKAEARAFLERHRK